MRSWLWLALALLVLNPLSAKAENAPASATTAAPTTTSDEAAQREAMKAKLQAFEAALKWQQGTVMLKGNLAKLEVPKEFRYLDPKQAASVLRIWGNNHVTEDATLGMLFPADKGPLAADGWGVVITYEEDGHVKDDDAAKIDYDKLLKDMQASEAEGNEQRKQAGERAITLMGWATPPKYDSASHKMYWAKELKWEGAEHSTLNYNIRILGKEGVLVVNAVAEMSQLKLIESQTPQILAFVDFTPGNRYEDYKEGVHKLAAYGLTGLIAGGIAAKVVAKAGLLKFLMPILIAGKKFAVLGLAAIAGLFGKIFRRRKDGDGTPA